MTGLPLVSELIAVPALGAAALLLVPQGARTLLRIVALAATGWTLALAAAAFLCCNPPAKLSHGPLPWIAPLGAQYHVGFDGLSGGLVLLTAFLAPVVVLSSWRQAERSEKGFLACLLTLETGLLGTFLARDLLLFYCFWEIVLIPMYLWIGLWGGRRRRYATIKLVLFTAAGSLLMLVAILAVARRGGGWDFSMDRLPAAMPLSTERWLLWAFLAAFLVKVPLWPLHTWLPDAHVEAPTAGSVFLAGVLLKMGTYGLLRIAIPFFPRAFQEALPVLVALGAIGAVWGGLMSLAQRDIKSLVAYSSVSHMAVIVLGAAAMTPAGIQGASLQMLAHGVNTGALFLLVGVLYERTHSREIGDFGGLFGVMPVFSALFLVACLSSLGLPGLAAFPGELLILKGLLDRAILSHSALYLAAFACAALAVVLSAAYLLWMFMRVFFGPLRHPGDVPADLGRRETLAAGALVAAMVAMGLFPSIWLSRTAQAAASLLSGGTP